MSINEDGAKELEVGPVIRQLKALKPALDLPALAYESWDFVWAVLEHIRLQFDEVAATIKVYGNTPRINFSLFRYLSKVVSISRDTKVLMKLQIHPVWECLFTKKESEDIQFNLPKSRAGWTQVVQDALQWPNMAAKIKGELKLKLDSLNAVQYAAKICEAPLRNTNFVQYCELNIIGYILQSSEEGFLNYIGLSKLCCRGCSQYIQAVEYILEMRFKVKGTYQKFYYPWAFPNLPHASAVLEQMRNSISFVFGQTYKGFFPDTNPYLSDSEATASSGEDEKGEEMIAIL